jgi:NADH:ubiquinone reductase (H+-translocating)
MKHVVIIGGGFAGLNLALRLKNKPYVKCTLIDKENFHQFQPLYYQVATAGIDPSSISFPFRKIFQNAKNIVFKWQQVISLNSQNQTIQTAEEIINYDYLVLATGATTQFFNEQNAKLTYGMKTTSEALHIRNQLIENFEKAVKATSETERSFYENIVIVGGGATGVELSGALAEMKKHILPKDYPELNWDNFNIHLIEGGHKLLGSMSDKSSKNSLGYLQKLGVQVQLNTLVKHYDGSVITLANGNTIPAKMVLWAAGITGNKIEGTINETLQKGNRYLVNHYNQVQGFNNVFALGDVAFMPTEKYPNGHPQVANVAITQANTLAKNLIAWKWNPAKAKPYNYFDKGSMATVGRNLAVVDIPFGKLHLKGLIAWLIWMGLHLLLLIGVKNRVQVFINWVYQYFTYDQSLRLIIKPPKK